MITDTKFGTVEIRARRPCRILDPQHDYTNQLIYIESVEVCVIKEPMPADGLCLFPDQTAIYFGEKEFCDDKAGHIIM